METFEPWRRKCSKMGIEIYEFSLTEFFAEDQVIVANCEERIDYMLRKLDEECEKWGLNMNMKKTGYLYTGEEEEDLNLQLRKLRVYKEYKY